MWTPWLVLAGEDDPPWQTLTLRSVVGRYIYKEIEALVPKLPAFLQKIIATDGAAAALAYTADVTKAYTPQRFFDELHGLADGLNNTM